MNPGLRDLTSGVWSKVPKVDVEPAIRIVNHETKPNQTKPNQTKPNQTSAVTSGIRDCEPTQVTVASSKITNAYASRVADSCVGWFEP